MNNYTSTDTSYHVYPKPKNLNALYQPNVLFNPLHAGIKLKQVHCEEIKMFKMFKFTWKTVNPQINLYEYKEVFTVLNLSISFSDIFLMNLSNANHDKKLIRNFEVTQEFPHTPLLHRNTVISIFKQSTNTQKDTHVNL